MRRNQSRRVVPSIALAALFLTIATTAQAQLRAPLPGVPRPASTATTAAIPGMGPLPMNNGGPSTAYFSHQRSMYSVLDDFEDVDVFADQRKDGSTRNFSTPSSRARRQYRPNSLTDGDLAARRRQSSARDFDALGKTNPSRRGEASPRLASSLPAGLLPTDRARSGMSSLSSGIPSLDRFNLTARPPGSIAAPRTAAAHPNAAPAASPLTRPTAGSAVRRSLDIPVTPRRGSSLYDTPTRSSASARPSATAADRKITPSELLRRTLEADKSARTATQRPPTIPPTRRAPNQKVFEPLDDIE